MVDTREPDVYAAPSPLPPTEAELASWGALSRDEQLDRYREALHQPDCDRISTSPWRMFWSVSPPGPVAKFRLSASVEAGLIAIHDFNEMTFGEYQAEAYLSGLDRTFGLLADFPGLGRPLTSFAPAIAVFASKLILYSTRSRPMAVSSARFFTMPRIYDRSSFLEFVASLSTLPV